MQCVALWLTARAHTTNATNTNATRYARQRGLFDLFFSPRLLKAVETVVGAEITLNPIQHCRPFLPAKGGKHTNAGGPLLVLRLHACGTEQSGLV